MESDTISSGIHYSEDDSRSGKFDFSEELRYLVARALSKLPVKNHEVDAVGISSMIGDLSYAIAFILSGIKTEDKSTANMQVRAILNSINDMVTTYIDEIIKYRKGKSCE